MPWPTEVMAPKIVSAMSAAINPYSTAVTPSSSAASRRSPRGRRGGRWLIEKIPRDSGEGSHQRGEVGDQRDIGLRHGILAQPVRSHPGELLSLLGHHRSFPAPAHIKRHQQVKLRIAVARKSQRREAGFLDDDPELLLELPG